jgi:hypothetical protein
MVQKKITSNKDKIGVIKGIYNQALIDIDKIKKERDKKIRTILKDIDNKHIAKTRQDIKNLK